MMRTLRFALALVVILGVPPAAVVADPGVPFLDASPEDPVEEPAPVTGSEARFPSQEVGRQAEIERAVATYRKTGEAAVLKRHDAILYPFDESQPVIKCSPLRACDVELQAGEIVTGVAVGDSERWVTSPLLSGEPDRPTPHVIVKPKEYDLATNLVIGTTRRTYHLGLISPSEERVLGGELAYFRHVAFYYPSELVQEWATRESLAAIEDGRREEARVLEVSALTVDALNFDYRVRADRKALFAPKTVFDDGRHVYLELPGSVRSTDLPAVLIEAPDGSMAVSNYRLQGSWYIIDGLFRRAELVVGAGRSKRSVRIENLASLAEEASQ